MLKRLCLAAALAAPLCAVVSGASAMSMAVRGSELVLSGFVEMTTADRIVRLLERNPGIRVVTFRDSVGGHAEGMFRVAEAIRRRGLETRLAGRCQSACAVMFMGGVRRTLAPGADPARAYVGFHGVFDQHRVPHQAWNARLKAAVERLSDRRMPAATANAMVALPPEGLAAFHPPSARMGGRGSVRWCTGAGPGRPGNCRMRTDMDAVRVGVFTR